MLLKTGVTTNFTLPRVTLPLINTQINNAKPKDKENNLSDGEGLLQRDNHILVCKLIHK